MLWQILTQASLVAQLSLVVSVLPLVFGAAYAIRPSEQRLALMRPVSLAGLFAALCGLLVGAINILRGLAIADTPVPARILAIGAAESLVPLFVAFACLTVGWLCVALGLRRHA